MGREIVHEYLKDKTSPDSRYRRTKILIDGDNNEFYETWSKPRIEESSDDIYHQVDIAEENRLDLIAYRYYQNTLLYWVIASANNISNPLIIPAGTVLRIPSIRTIYGFRGVASR
ncbi:hypothetical protein HSE3_gp078 [Bacillus phage vB_BceM-HSE3]|nr:hypothetical protein HSE3_gp078 [Bacillus phage vB_BceM-HSE3]